MTNFVRDQSEPTLDIDGAMLASSSPGFEQAIATAYSMRRRPRCLCSPEGVEMYVARLGDGYIVKRMPDTGSQHAPDCASFEPPAELSGRRHLLGKAIKENPQTGMTTLRLGFSLSKGPTRTTPTSPRSPSCTASTAATRLSLLGLLHYLWEQAGLTRWHPGFEGRRSWPTVRCQLQRAAEQTLACGEPLATRIYIPEPFFVERRDEIIRRRQALWTRPGNPGASRQRLFLLVAEVKAIEPARHGHKLVVKHIPDVAFALDDSLYHQLPKRCAQALELWGTSNSIRMLMIATFAIRSAGVPHIAELSLMTLTAQWLPAETLAELQLLESLVNKRRAFLKLLHYGVSTKTQPASLALTDRGAPAPLMYTHDREK